MTDQRRERLKSERLKRQSDLFHAFEWLREHAHKNNHAATLLRELGRLNKGRKGMWQKPKWE